MKKTLTIILSFILIFSFTISSVGFTTVAVKSISINKNSISLKTGESFNLKVTFTPSNATNKRLSYSTTNKSIVSVDANGKIKGLKAGKAVITVTSLSNKKAVAKCNVTVLAQNTQTPTNKYTITYLAFRMEPNSNSEVMKLIREKLGQNLKVTAIMPPLTDYTQKLNILYAANELPDVFTTFGNNVVLRGGTAKFTEDELKQNMPMSYQTALKQYERQGYKKENVLKRWTVNGKLAGINIGSDDLADPYTLVIRKDIVDELGKSIPKTIADWEDLMKAYKAKYPKKYPLTAPGKQNPNQSFQVFIDAFGASYDKWLLKDGKLVYGPTTKEMRTALALLQKWYKSGFINPEFYTMDATSLINDFINNGMIFRQFEAMSTIINPPYTAQPNSVFAQTTAKNPNAKFDFVSYPVLQAGQKGIAHVWEPVQDQPICFGRHLENKRDKLRAAMNMIDKLYNDKELVYLRYYGIEGKHYDMVDGVPVRRVEFSTVDAMKNAGIVWANGAVFGKKWEIEKTFMPKVYTEYIKTLVDNPKGIYSDNNIVRTFNRVNGPLVSSSGEQLDPLGRNKVTQWDSMFVGVVTGTKTLEDYDKFIVEWKNEILDKQTEAANRLYLDQWK
jgi:ABC-type glycerol-3-phosphate transport system substrate-binding protein